MITSSGLKSVKPFLTYEQQIEHLITNKKLIINDEDSAMKSLSNITMLLLAAISLYSMIPCPGLICLVRLSKIL